MDMIVNRGPAIGQALPGEMTIGGTHACFTLERVAVAIAAGRYEVKLYLSPHFQRLMPWIQVPGRQYILLHWGDYPFNSDGCILVGEIQDASTGNIFETQKEFNALFPAIEAAVNTEGCWITVTDPQPGVVQSPQ